MHGGGKRGIEICGMNSSRRPRHTRGCSAEEEGENNRNSSQREINPVKAK
jgi:hypothetical protein